MSKEKLPPEEGGGGGHIEIPLPISVNDSFEKGRVFHYGITRWGYGFLLFIAVGCALTALTEIPDSLFLLWGFLLLMVAVLLLLAKYEIRHDKDGFSACLGKRIFRRYAWSDVTAVNHEKRVFVGGRKLFADPSMSGYEAFYARARAACKKKGQPVPPLEEKQKSHPNPPAQEGKDGANKGFIEISLPNLSGIKDKVDDGFERLVYGNVSRKFDGDYKKGEGRLGLDPIFGKVGIVSAVLTGVAFILCAVLRADYHVTFLLFFLLLLCLTLTVISKYEIRFDGKGFSTRFGNRILHAYKWSDVTGVQDGKKVWVQGKRLWTDSTFDNFSDFYKMARSACKGKGKPTPPSEKKRRNRKKQKNTRK